MSDLQIIHHCAPTLAGLKTGSLFSCSYKSKAQIQSSIRKFNKKLSCKGIRILPLRYSKNRVLIYIYRPLQLQADFLSKESQEILKAANYPCNNPNACIIKLMQKLQENSEFPHEIGLFLGYPSSDVKGFIEGKASGYKYVGPWKVYSNLDKALSTFEKYKRCSACYFSQWKKGVDIETLTIAI